MNKDSQQKAKKTCAVFNAALLINTAVEKTVLWLYIIAGVIIVVKLAGLHKIIIPDYLLLTAVFVPAAVLNIYLKKRYSLKDAACWLDLKEEAGGSYITAVCGGREHDITYRYNIKTHLKPAVFIYRLLKPCRSSQVQNCKILKLRNC